MRSGRDERVKREGNNNRRSILSVNIHNVGRNAARLVVEIR